MIRKILAAVLIAAGLAAMSVPLFYHFYGSHKTDGLIEQFEKSVEQEQMEDDEKEEEKKTNALKGIDLYTFLYGFDEDVEENKIDDLDKDYENNEDDFFA